MHIHRFLLNCFFKTLVYLGIVLPTSSFAINTAETSGSGGFTPPATDWSMAFLADIFGSVDGVLYSNGSQMMGNLFAVFNAAVLAIAGIIVMYVLIIATMNTAQEGKFLGQKWSSMWIPIRTTIGLSLLFPKSSGFCLMQVFVMWVVVQGIGAADKIWGAALQYLNRGGAIVLQQINTAAPQYAASTSQIASGTMGVLAGQVCMISLQKQLQLAQNNFKAQANTPGTLCNTSNGPLQTGSPAYIICNEQIPDFTTSVNFVEIQQQATVWATSSYTCQCSSNQTEYNCPCPPPVGFTAPMPNFNAFSSPFAVLNGVCGAIQWNGLTSSQMGLANNVSTLTNADLSAVQYSRAMAIQQMYQDMYTVANSMVNNDPQLNPQMQINANEGAGYSAWAANQFGVAYLSGGTAPCTGTNASCTLWGPDQASGVKAPVLFSGTEFQTAIADYDAAMAPTLNLLQEGTNASSASGARAFIQTSLQDGWITAGQYFFNVVQLNAQAMSNAQSDVDTSSGLEKSQAMCNLSAAFQTTTSCSTTAKCSYSTITGGTYYPNIAALCQMFNNRSNYIAPINNLIAGGTALSNPTFSSSSMSAIVGTNSSTTYAFGNNGYLVNMPGQPGVTTPIFKMNPVVGAPPAMQNSAMNFPCGNVPILGCLGRMIGNILVNDFLFPFLNAMASAISTALQAYIITFAQVPMENLVSIIVSSIDQLSGVNPIVGLASMGINIIDYSTEVIINMVLNLVFIVIGSFAAGAIIPIVGGPIIAVVLIPPLLVITALVGTWLGIYMGIAFMTAYYVPAIPYMTFLFGSIGWIIAVIEAMVAAPLVAVAFTYPEGNETLGKGEAGLMILLNVFLRPSLMIIGYIAAIALSYVVVWLLNSGFAQSQNFYNHPVVSGGTIYAASVGLKYLNWSSVFSFFFSTLLYVMIYWVTVEKSFTLIYLLPDQILRWIGGAPEHIGQETSGWMQQTREQMSQAGSKTEGFMANFGGGSASSASSSASSLATVAKAGAETAA